MPELKTYDLFISHAWRYNDDYLRLEDLFRNTNFFKWRNYSVPQDHSLVDIEKHSYKKELLELLEKQIRPVNAVLILGGMYAVHSDWMLEEIKIAQQYDKPIIGVYPWGHQHMPVAIQEAACELVGWNIATIVSAIRRNAL